MRIFKFRAWDKNEKCWVPGGQGFHILGESMLRVGILHNYSLDHFNDIELMQYIGLKDKTGEDIYEGDIVKEGDDPINSRNIFEVIFKDCSFTYKPNQRAQFKDYTLSPLCCQVRIIGNIYENGELLK